jgi:2-polyprenyl-6-methoxyphenol hydroxylase-like FAD-dependent oxidoreductase
LATADVSVALIDFRDRHPPEFKAEKIGDRQVAFLESFGLGEAAHRQLTRFEGVWEHRFGRLIDRTHRVEYSSPYAELVNTLRDALPASVGNLHGRVGGVETGEAEQQVQLGDGRRVVARLLVVASGQGEAIRHQLGVERAVASPLHSLASGFDIATPPSGFPFTSLVWISERPADRIAYLTIFPMGGRMRANLFSYHRPDDPWVMALRRDPAAAIAQLLPRFDRRFGRLEVSGPVQVRPIDVATARGHRRPGFVLTGDAFFTTCPATGTGMDKALNDADLLRRFVPLWLATPGMGADKIGQFYDAPEKRASDQESIDVSFRERAVRMDLGWNGRARRLRRNVVRRGVYRIRELLAMPEWSGVR